MSKADLDAMQNEGFYEINICAEHLARPFEQVAETLLHEMVHLYNLQIGVQDTSRNGTYHNKKCKGAAEQHGLDVGKDPKYGWTITTLDEEARAFVDSLQDKKFELHRKHLPKIQENDDSTITATVQATRAAETAPTPTAGQTYTVKSGDSLCAIAKKYYGSSSKYTDIYNANKSVIGGNPNLIKPGQVLTLPESS